MKEANIKLKGGKEFKAKKCKIELADGSVIWASRVIYEPDYQPPFGDFVPEEVYHCTPCGKHFSKRIPRYEIKRMSIIRESK